MQATLEFELADSFRVELEELNLMEWAYFAFNLHADFLLKLFEELIDQLGDNSFFNLTLLSLFYFRKGEEAF